jgi:hypothetical protein
MKMPKKQWEIFADYQWSYYGAVGEETYRIIFNSQYKTLTLQWESELTFPEELPILEVPCAEMPTVQQAISVIAKAMAKRIRSL